MCVKMFQANLGWLVLLSEILLPERMADIFESMIEENISYKYKNNQSKFTQKKND